VFHAKLLLLQAGRHVLVGAGSGNLTPGGLGGNLELMLFASNHDADGRALAESAVQFLKDLLEAASSDQISIPESAMQYLRLVNESLPCAEGGPVLHSLMRPLIEQLPVGKPSAVERLVVVSPWHSSTASSEGVEPKVLQALARQLGRQPEVHTEGRDGRGPNLGKGTPVRIVKAWTSSRTDTDTDLDDEDADAYERPPPRTLHAKAYLAIGKDAATLWFGSANCTTPALLRAATSGGNVELLIRTRLGAKGLTALTRDLNELFEEPPSGLFASRRRKSFDAARGSILSASWEQDARSLTIELVPGAPPRSVQIGRVARDAQPVEVAIQEGACRGRLEGAAAERLCEGREMPAVLWELADGEAIPFPVSIPCVSPTTDPEKALEDLLNDLAGRMPAGLRSQRGRSQQDDDPADAEVEGVDKELALLSKTQHQGRLDRLAVRVELLRRRRAAAAWQSAESDAFYRELIQRLDIPIELRRILVQHLAPVRKAQ
jgi:hypothetical protein